MTDDEKQELQDRIANLCQRYGLSNVGRTLAGFIEIEADETIGEISDALWEASRLAHSVADRLNKLDGLE